MTVSRSAVEQYLREVKDSIRNDRYVIARNLKRQDNVNLFVDYIIDEACAKAILLSLEADDFSEVRQNTHIGQEHEILWIFGKNVNLICIWRSKKERRPPRMGELCRHRREYQPPETGIPDALAGG